MIRGMVIGADAERLIVQASAAEVSRFAHGVAVSVDVMTALKSPIAAPIPSHDFNLADPFDSSIVTIKLMTRCGCVQWRIVPSPPPYEFRVAIGALKATPISNVDDPVALQLRVFLRDHYEYRSDGRRVILYREMADER